MGQCAQGDIQIELQTIEDADYVYSQIEKIVELTEARIEGPAYFDLQDNHVEDSSFNCNVYSSRTQNGEFQINQVVEQLKIMVTEGKIKPPISFQGELTVQYESWYLDQDNFELGSND